jgi:hypothetical protein
LSLKACSRERDRYLKKTVQESVKEFARAFLIVFSQPALTALEVVKAIFIVKTFFFIVSLRFKLSQ